MPGKTPPETLAQIIKMIDAKISDTQIAEVVGMSKTGIMYIRHRHELGVLDARSQGQRTEYDVGNKAVFETEDQAARFARAMKGERFESIRTKSYGRALPPHPSHVMTQSSAGNCVDAA